MQPRRKEMRLRGVSPVIWAAVLLAAIVALAVAGCGGGGSSSSSSSEPSTSEPAETGSEPSSEEEPAESEPASDEGGSGEFNLAEWEAKTEKYEEGPTEYFGPTEPVKVPSGQSLAWIPCSAVIRGCVRPVEAAGEIAEELG